MQDNTSPEERLLRLIRGDHKESSRKQEQAPGNIQVPQSPEAVQKTPLLNRIFSFNLINQILLAISLISGLYLAADFLIINSHKMEKRIQALEEVEVKAAQIQAMLKPPEPVTYYTEPVKSRDLFTAAAPKTTQLAPTASFLEMVSKFRLQGIVSSGSNPQAIIEDTKTRQVYFLSPGESIGGIELKAVLQGKVKLHYYGQEVELSL